jgi:hypothetical protein
MRAQVVRRVWTLRAKLDDVVHFRAASSRWAAPTKKGSHKLANSNQQTIQAFNIDRLSMADPVSLVLSPENLGPDVCRTESKMLN